MQLTDGIQIDARVLDLYIQKEVTLRRHRTRHAYTAKLPIVAFGKYTAFRTKLKTVLKDIEYCFFEYN